MYEDEPDITVSEMINLLLKNDDKRYVLIGTLDKVRAGRALIFDTIERKWIRISSRDGEDKLHQSTVLQMLSNGARVEAVAPKA